MKSQRTTTKISLGSRSRTPQRTGSQWAAQALLMLALALLGTGAACSPEIGDSCLNNNECGSGAICDTTVPEGYCTMTPCKPNECPDEAVCVEFDNEQTFCMARCQDGGDCRDGYQCRDNQGPVRFCYVP